MIQIDAELDGGSIHVIDASSPEAIELALRPDSAAEFMQWFCFRARAKESVPLTFRIGNAGEATYPDAWEGYNACASYDGETWFRVPTEYDGEALTFRHTPEQEETIYAYFAPYAFDRHQALIERAAAAPGVRVEQLGETVQGRPLDLVVLGDEEGDGPRIWITGRQHPGETMAAWFMDGILERLLDTDDPLTRELLGRAAFYLVPCMNPDGGVLGNLRTNAAGRNLNREWIEPSEEESPEVFHVRAAMEETGVDLFLDIHGDERTPYCFAAGCEGNPSYSERIEELEDMFLDSLLELETEFQREIGYDRDLPGEGDLTTAGNFVGERFDCLSLTLEMPFKDNANNPDPTTGWSPNRARKLARSTLESVLVCLDSLR